MAAVREKLSGRPQRHLPEGSSRAALRHFRHEPRRELARLPSVTIATGGRHQVTILTDIDMRSGRNIPLSTGRYCLRHSPPILSGV